MMQRTSVSGASVGFYRAHAGFSMQSNMRESRGLFGDSVEAVMKAYMCVICGFVYEEEKGLPEQGIAPGTVWADVPENFKCPECGATKTDFEMVEI